MERGVVSVGLCLRPSEDVVSIIKQFNLVLCEVLSNVFVSEKQKPQKIQRLEILVFIFLIIACLFLLSSRLVFIIFIQQENKVKSLKVFSLTAWRLSQVFKDG